MDRVICFGLLITWLSFSAHFFRSMVGRDKPQLFDYFGAASCGALLTLLSALFAGLILILVSGMLGYLS